MTRRKETPTERMVLKIPPLKNDHCGAPYPASQASGHKAA